MARAAQNAGAAALVLVNPKNRRRVDQLLRRAPLRGETLSGGSTGAEGDSIWDEHEGLSILTVFVSEKEYAKLRLRSVDGERDTVDVEDAHGGESVEIELFPGRVRQTMEDGSRANSFTTFPTLSFTALFLIISVCNIV